MGLFTKAEFLEVVLPFLCDNSSEDADACVISIEAFGHMIDGFKYFYASFEVGANHYDELSKLLFATKQKQVKVIVKIKNGIAKSFKIDLIDLAERFHDKRFERMILLGWGINDKSAVKQNHQI